MQVDERLVAEIERLKSGDFSNYQEFYQMTAPTIYRRLNELLGNREMADRAIKDVYDEIYRNIGSLQDNQQFFQWADSFVSRRVMMSNTDTGMMQAPPMPSETARMQAPPMPSETAKKAMRTSTKIMIGSIATLVVVGAIVGTCLLLNKDKPKGKTDGTTAAVAATEEIPNTEEMTGADERQAVEQTTEQTTEEITTEDPMAILQEESMTLYGQFLSGETTAMWTENSYSLSGVGYNPTYSDNSEVELHRGYTLSEIKDKIFENNPSDNQPSGVTVSYAYIDCGRDGVSELALKISAEDFGMALGASSDYYVIKNVEGQLVICAHCQSLYRTFGTLDVDGFMEEGGSGGATSHYSSEYVVMADGTLEMVYELDVEGSMSSVDYMGDDALIQAYNLYQQSYSDDYSVEINQYRIDGAFYYVMKMYEYSDEGQYYIDCATQLGMNICTQEEIDAIIQERRDNLVTEPVTRGDIAWIAQ